MKDMYSKAKKTVKKIGSVAIDPFKSAEELGRRANKKIQAGATKSGTYGKMAELKRKKSEMVKNEAMTKARNKQKEAMK